MIRKQIFISVILFLFSILGFLIVHNEQSKNSIEKKLSFAAPESTEVFLVWGLMNKSLPDSIQWPDSSFFKDNMVWTKTTRIDSQFNATLKLSPGTQIYYWKVTTKDKAGNPTEEWDSGGGNDPYYTDYVSFPIFHPGIFIFIAGILPLLYLFCTNRNKKPLNISNQFVIPSYIPQLDALRAIAVLLVIIHHWLPHKSVLNFLPNGRLGVNIFFVLSGFLITSILLKGKKQAEKQQVTTGDLFKTFYIRRTLRIFPIYYLFLLILWFIKDADVRQDGVYYWTYTSNYLFYNQGMFAARTAHLWSLGVEEQFYLFWPWLIVFIRRKFLPYFIGLTAVIGISINYIFLSKGWWIEITTPACLDAFAMGAGLSFLIAYRQDLIKKFQAYYIYFLLISLLLFVLDVYKVSFLPPRTVHSLLGIALIYYCLFKNNNAVANFILNNKWLIRLGKISYGIYLYHLVVPELWENANNWLVTHHADFFFTNSVSPELRTAWIFIQQFILLLIISAVSWTLLEKPVNNLKKAFTLKAKPFPTA
jgi:peptidoglycan/LPS O-acetylase OafA/YrhL